MKIVSSKHMKQLDLTAQEKFGIPSLILMENAGLRAADIALAMLKNKKRPKAAVFCGQGNNGGDGLVVVRHLINKGIKASVGIAGDLNKMTQDAVINRNILLKMGQCLENISAKNVMGICAKNIDLIIDGIFGIGYKGIVKEPFYSIIKCINLTGLPVLSLDIPSGLDADSGKVENIAVYAKQTVTFGYLKKGMLINQGKVYCGRISVVDISLPRNL
ncbi:MAG: NAD(P)H-hydrate epimerase [Candidatus Omnitrophota bacterium]